MLAVGRSRKVVAPNGELPPFGSQNLASLAGARFSFGRRTRLIAVLETVPKCSVGGVDGVAMVPRSLHPNERDSGNLTKAHQPLPYTIQPLKEITRAGKV